MKISTLLNKLTKNKRPFLIVLGILIIGAFILYAFRKPAYNYVQSKYRNIVYSSAKENYEKYCAGCHGDNRDKFVDRKWIYGNSWNEVFNSIKNGYVNDGMPSYDTTFTDAEIKDLVDYILIGIEEVTTKKMEEDHSLEGTIKSKGLNFHLEEVVTGLEVPWGMAFLPNGDMLITERNGTFYRFTKDKKLQKIKGVPKVKARGQGGLLDVKLHPNYKKNGWLYLSYSKPNPENSEEGTTAVIRAKLKGNELVKVEEIFEAKPYLPTNHHYGSRLEFDKDGYLYISVGDRGRRDENPQSLDNHCGKIHRIKDDGSIPKDNPFVNTEGAMPSIYSYGHRNAQGIAINEETNVLWIHEHGPRGGDEINVIEPGKNYGWPVISYGINYNGTKFTDITEKDGMEQPLLYWVPSIAPSGVVFVTDDRYKAWKGDFLVGSLRFKYVNRCVIKDGKVVEEEKLLKNIGRVRDIKTSPDGYIYVAVETPGKIYKIVPEE